MILLLLLLLLLLKTNNLHIQSKHKKYTLFTTACSGGQPPSSGTAPETGLI
jgi:hypothetical protein